MQPIQIYAGYDSREAVGFHVFAQSIIENSSVPVAITPLHKPMLKAALGDVPDGSNAFTFSRFLIPHIQNFMGTAIFMDGADMLCRADIAELEALRRPDCAVQVVRHEYKTKHARKYIGTKMEAENRDYERKQWASVMLINCYHHSWRRISAEKMKGMTPLEILQLRFIEDRYIGEIPIEWNWLVDEFGESEDAKVLHWTAGIPAFDHYRLSPHADEWFNGLGKVHRADNA